MKKLTLASLVIFPLILSGCASVGRSSAVWPWPTDKQMCAGDVCTEKEALQAFLQAQYFCRSVHNYYEADGNQAGASQLAVATVGSLAGAVVAPIASGNAAKAWSGLSGATNAMQTSIKENFSGSISAKRTKAVLDATEKWQEEIKKAYDPTNKVRYAIQMATACTMAPAKADNAAFKALAGE